ncbi:hypothetical protein A11A3_16450 [Alcanivorax hongdengensis A-11-3]|uniref:DUF306 domain-containing protein n=1 Tax=Alcanivorax hongdengensis A-11-3 TaxID=1177179 RepID=L0W7J8_9GAMM|nr:META domain-containing protein [Alcanivorax hongdengensis]EKF72889.1 hypothetical protein A11A3_16450 [Alcanivorax hongdengensis A-11-3]
MNSRFACLAIAALTLGACTSQPARDPQPISDADLASDVWKVETLNGNTVDNATLTLHFHAPDKVSGKAACNGYMASYHRDGGQFHIQVGGVTMMACPTPLMELEKQFLDTLSDIDQAVLDKDGRLILTGKEGLRVQATR